VCCLLTLDLRSIQLVKCGFKEIEIAYPAASETDFSFVRMIVDKKMGVDEGVWIQVSLMSSSGIIELEL
jgi:2-isopropylmalate synthase